MPAFGAAEQSLRPWQQAALSAYEAVERRRDFLVTATPGAGKTTFALAVAARLLRRRTVDRVVVVCPTDHLRVQWADAAARAGMVLDPAMTNAQGAVPDGAHGYVATYAQVAARPVIHAARCRRARTLVVLDEVHHAGDGLSWGEALGEAFEEVPRRLCLTGTPFRTRAGERIPFVTYEQDGDLLRSVADFVYSYQTALADGVVRPVVFAAYSGVSRWRNSAGDVVAASLTEAGTKSVEAAAWRTALDPAGGWVPHVLAAMDERISQLRAAGMRDAAGLVLAGDQSAARAYAQVAERITGESPAVILSDDPAASRRIEEFRTSSQRLAVCVRMISEGVDVPRAACLAWMTPYRTPLFFAQAVGRVVRARGPAESATVFLPAVRPLLALAAEMETERNHVMAAPPPADDTLIDALDVRPAAGSGAAALESLESQAHFAHVLQAGRAVTAAASVAAPNLDEEEFLGLPGLLSAEQTATLLARRDAELRRRVDAAARQRPDRGADRGSANAAGGVPAAAAVAEAHGWRATAALRREVNALVGRIAARTGTPHAAIHRQVRQAVPGPASAAAAPELLERRRDHLLSML